MKRMIFIASLGFMSTVASAKTVSDFINEHPDIAKNPTIKAAIQEGAMGNAVMAAASDGLPPEALSDKSTELLRENGYEYAQATLRDLATLNCSDKEYADISGFREKDCQTIIRVDSEIE
ncbi:hypothetical protein FJU30_21025 [Affinibrenneria salicis]|uniref:Uncharacterized protein n=1 Tax=Affinibrenneria salicis TaxID=2590031 RepID=A0A5J5FTV6_9GAMM|nr:hypothetical protein [Affinibrenneria salicis]KAA8996689.1 hypothetical protein FJU30_21025 [Affinibrenneria salicis]